MERSLLYAPFQFRTTCRKQLLVCTASKCVQLAEAALLMHRQNGRADIAASATQTTKVVRKQNGLLIMTKMLRATLPSGVMVVIARCITMTDTTCSTLAM